MAEMLAEKVGSQNPLLLRMAMKAARVAVGICVGLPSVAVAGVGVDAVVGYLVSYRDTEVTRVDIPADAQGPNYDPDSATIVLNGQGPDASCDQAKAIEPVVGKYGPLFCMTYPAAYGDGSVSADKAHQVMFGSLSPDEEKHVTIVGSSAGDKRAYLLGRQLHDKYNVQLDGLLMNTGVGPFGKQRLRSDFFRNYIDKVCQNTPGKVALGGTQIGVDQGDGHQANSLSDYWDMFMKGFELNNRVVQDINCTIEDVLTDKPAEVPDFQSVGYMLPDKTGYDGVVDTDGAARDWQQVFPNMQIIEVGGQITHDNLAFRPEEYNPVVATFYQAMRDLRYRIEHPARNTRIR